MNNLKICLVQYSGNASGSTISGLMLADGFLEAGWKTYIVFGFEGSVVRSYHNSGHEAYIVAHKNWLRRSHPLRFVKDIWQERQTATGRFLELFEKLQPDVVYINTIVSYAAAVAAKKLRIPVIWHIRELFADVGGEMQAPPWARKWIKNSITRLSTHIVVNSKAVATNVFETLKSENISVIPNAVANHFFHDNRTQSGARQALRLSEGYIFIGVPGTLRPGKGHVFFFTSNSAFVAV